MYPIHLVRRVTMQMPKNPIANLQPRRPALMLLDPPTSLMKPLPRRRNRLLQPQRPQQEILNRKQRQEDLIAQKRQTGNDARDHGIQPVMIRRRNDRD